MDLPISKANVAWQYERRWIITHGKEKANELKEKDVYCSSLPTLICPFSILKKKKNKEFSKFHY